MKQITLTIQNDQDIPAILARSLGNIESLRGYEQSWGSLLEAMGIKLLEEKYSHLPAKTVQQAAQHIVAVAVPQCGPNRATIIGGAGPDCAAFATPDNGVRVIIFPTVKDDGADRTGIDLVLEFHNEDLRLMILVLVEIYRDMRPVIRLLHQATKEELASYEASKAPS